MVHAGAVVAAGVSQVRTGTHIPSHIIDNDRHVALHTTAIICSEFK